MYAKAHFNGMLKELFIADYVYRGYSAKYVSLITILLQDKVEIIHSICDSLLQLWHKVNTGKCVSVCVFVYGNGLCTPMWMTWHLASQVKIVLMYLHTLNWVHTFTDITLVPSFMLHTNFMYWSLVYTFSNKRSSCHFQPVIYPYSFITIPIQSGVSIKCCYMHYCMFLLVANGYHQLYTSSNWRTPIEGRFRRKKICQQS